MKKLAILFLLTAVLASFAFAQVSLKADFAVKNVNKGNTVIDTTKAWFDAGQNGAAPTPGTIGQIGYADPTLTFVLAGAASQDIGPGKLGFEGAVGIANSFADTDYGMINIYGTAYQTGFKGGSGVAPTDDTYAGVTYGFGAGPGTLGFGVNYKFNGLDGYMWTLEPSVQYTGINAGPVVFGVGLLYDYKFDGVSTDNATGTPKGAPFFHRYGESYSTDQIKFWFDVNTTFGLYIKYQFSYGWGKDATGRASFYRGFKDTQNYQSYFAYKPTSTELQGQREITNIAYLDINYALGGLAKVGLEVDDTGPGFRGAYLKFGALDQTVFNTETAGFTLKPYVNFAVSNLGFGAYLTFNHVMPTNVDAEIQVKPGVWVKYSL